MIYALDIETQSLTTDTKDALIPHLSKIVCIGAWAPGDENWVYWDDLKDFQKYLDYHSCVEFVGHNLKFDLKHLIHHGVNFDIKRWVDDTQLMASVLCEKVTEEYLLGYEKDRIKANKSLPHGVSHRRGSRHSLKVMAPYFLKVPAFWENPADHSSPEYVLKDCEYTYKLYQLLKDKLQSEGTWDFYKRRLLRWTKMLLDSEIRGIQLDLKALGAQKAENTNYLHQIKNKLDEVWSEGHKAYYQKQRLEILKRYQEMENSYIINHNAKDPDQIKARYQRLASTAIEKLPRLINYGSSKQMQWLLKDHLGLNIDDFNGKPSSAKMTLNRLAREGRKDIQLFLEYRRLDKLITSFYPTYEHLTCEGTLHCQFNPTGTRTGRLSSAHPNLQQVAGALHCLFVARPGHKLITRDMASIEPRLVAYYTEDKKLCDLLINGGDFHSRNTIVMFNLSCPEDEVKSRYPQERFLAKTCGLALFYGAGPRRIQQTALTQGWNWSEAKCEKLFWKFHNYYKEAFRWKSEFDRSVKQKPSVNFLGRKHSYPEISDVRMKAFNTLIQSSASDLVLNSAWRFTTKIPESEAYPVLFVHDEIVVEAKETILRKAIETLEESMTKYSLLTQWGEIPLEVDGSVSTKWEK